MKISENYNFSYETKKEICNYYINNQETNIYLISAFLNNSAEIILNGNKKEYEFLTSYIDVIKLFKSFFNEDELYILISNQKTLKYKSTKYKVIVSPKEHKVIDDITKLDLEQFDIENEDELEKNNSVKSAIIAGLFLSSGSVSNPYNSNYHLEFRTSNESISNLISAILKSYEIHCSEIFHHKKHSVYIKKLQDISDILKLLNAHNNMFLLEEHRISNDFINTCHRLNNLDISNISKASHAYNELIKIIIGVKKTREYFQLSENIKIYCDIILSNEVLSMSQLVEILNEKFDKPITKSWINHTNIKLREIYKKYNN